MTINGYGVVKRLKDAEALYCPECDRLWNQLENPYWGLNKTKGLHERGAEHKTYYVALLDISKEA